MKMSEVQKVPLFVEVIGEPAVGKTHFSCLFPSPALLDTTPKGEGYFVLRKLHKDWKRRYFRVRSFEDIRKALKYIKVNKDAFRTVVVDTAADLRGLAIKECLEELRKEKPERQRLMPEEYSCVNEKVNGFIDDVTDPEGELCMNLVFTAQMKDEWIDRKNTGRRIRDGHPKANFQCDLRFFLQLKRKIDEKTMQYKDEYERHCRVVKNRFRDMTDAEDWVKELEDLSWKGVKALTKLGEGEFVE